MKKSLIALAVLAASGAAMAQSSVTMFGIVDTGVAYVSGGGNGTSNTQVTSGANATSRIGFRGVEDLGGGLKAGFWLEAGIGSDVGDGSGAGLSSGSGLGFARRSTVSLMGNFGEVRLGREEVATFARFSGYAPFSVIGIGGFRGWNTTVGDAIRQSNMISYYTPNVGGFNAGINYSFGERAGDSNGGRYIGGYVGYANGPLSLAIGLDRKNDAALTDGSYSAYRPGFTGSKVETVSVGGSYDLGVVKPSALYVQTKNKSAGVDTKQSSYLLGLSAPVGGVGEVKAQYALYDMDNNASGGNGKAHQLSLGYVHNLSKRTALYGTYTYLKNKDNRALTINGVSYAVEAGKASNGVQVGIRHAF